jgi:hypothetical protein
MTYYRSVVTNCKIVLANLRLDYKDNNFSRSFVRRRKSTVFYSHVIAPRQLATE